MCMPIKVGVHTYTTYANCRTLQPHGLNAELNFLPIPPIPRKERYVNHILFLSCCISENVIPNSLKLELELTIGNHDETFQNIGMNNCSNIC